MIGLGWLVLAAALVLPVPAATQGHGEQRSRIPLENSPSSGPADAAVTIIEFLDFQ